MRLCLLLAIGDLFMVRRARRRELGGNFIFYKWNEVEPKTSIVGKYVGTRLDGYEKTNWILVDEMGQKHALNHCGSLEHKMKDAEIGQVLEVVYEGTEPVKTKKYGTKDVHTFKVYCIDEDEDEVSEKPVVKSAAPAEASKKESTTFTVGGETFDLADFDLGDDDDDMDMLGL